MSIHSLESLPPIDASKFGSMDPMSQFLIEPDMREDDAEEDRDNHRVELLNEKQRRIYDYVVANPGTTVTIQAGPGTGKTYTLKTIAFVMKMFSSVIIYKHDLLKRFAHCSTRLTVAKLFMKMFSMNYPAYKAFTVQIGAHMSPQEFIYCLITLLNNAKLPPFRGGIVMLDEYTVIPKPLFIVLLMLLKRYRITTIISGDCNQLQSIQLAQNNGITSYEIAQLFSDKVFSLDVNQRCPDPKYNVLIKYISKISTSRKMDASGYALVAAIFMDKLASTSNFTDLHIAGTHRELTRLVHMYVVNESIPVEFYSIEKDKRGVKQLGILEDEDEEQDALDVMDSSVMLPNGLIQPSIVTKYIVDQEPKKFLPYLPLYIGGMYYIHTLTETSQGKLVAYNSEEQTVTMQRSNGEFTILGKQKCTLVVPEAHREAIMQKISGEIINFPIYPANVMTMHKCQGCTIELPLDINLADTTYQGMYVAISRVTNPSGIRRITMPDMLSHLLSTIINFPEHVKPNFDDFTEELLDSRMTNYQFYQISEPKQFVGLLSEFCNSRDERERAGIRYKLIDLSKSCMRKLLNMPEPIDRQEMLAINQFVRDSDIFMRAALIKNATDRAIWLHEFMRTNVKYSMLLQNPTCYRHNSLAVYCNPSMAYPFNVSTIDYILSKSQLEDDYNALRNCNRLMKHDDCYYKVSETRFQKIIYDRYMEDPSGSSITTEYLCSMLPTDDGYDATTSEPPAKRVKLI